MKIINHKHPQWCGFLFQIRAAAGRLGFGQALEPDFDEDVDEDFSPVENKNLFILLAGSLTGEVISSWTSNFSPPLNNQIRICLLKLDK